MTETSKCGVEGCQADTGGSCIEGFDDLTECPHFSPVEVDGDEVPDKASEGPNIELASAVVEAEVSPVQVYSGSALAVDEAHELTGEYSSSVVILMGMVRSGKTTVLAEVYERFRKGPFAGYYFAGSRTMLGFERIAHFSRAASLGEVEDTERTIRGTDNNLLHLDLVAQESAIRRRILVTDLSGEVFEQATLSSENLRQIPYLRRANHVIMFADAEKLSNVSERQSVVNNLLVLLRCAIEEGRIVPSCQVTIVISRHDLLSPGMDESFLDYMRNALRQRTSEYFEEPVHFLDLAARPTEGPDHAYGLEELLNAWCSTTRTSKIDVPNLLQVDGRIRREIDKFAVKVARHE